MDAAALTDRLPSGKHVFGDGTPAHRLPQLISIPSFTLLLLGALWSAWKMRGRPELRDRFMGTLLIALGASVVAGGATFAAVGNLPGFCITLVLGISTLSWVSTVWAARVALATTTLARAGATTAAQQELGPEKYARLSEQAKVFDAAMVGVHGRETGAIALFRIGVFPGRGAVETTMR